MHNATDSFNVKLTWSQKQDTTATH